MINEVKILDAGYCKSYERLSIENGKWQKVSFPATLGLIKTTSGKYILFDTGYAPRVKNQMKSFPYPLYDWLLPITIDENNTAASKLNALGIEPEEIATIIISHFHPDHIGGLKDFPHSQFICSKKSWNAVKSLSGISALRKGFLPDLIPDDFEERLLFAEELAECSLADQELSGWSIELHGSQIQLISLEGHVDGQIGLYIENAILSDIQAPIFFVADSCWTIRAIAEKNLPHKLSMIIQENCTQYYQTIKALQNLHNSNPDIRIIPSHCRKIHNV